MGSKKDKALKRDVYRDLLKPAVVQVGEMLQSTVKVARFAFAGIDYLAAKQDRWQTVLEKVAAGTDPQKLVNAHPQITGPVIEGMAYVDENSMIGEMFVNLLRKAIQSDTQNQAHPAFPRIIQQLSDDEAIILFFLKKGPYRVEQTWQLRNRNIEDLITTREDLPTSHLHYPQHIWMYMDHLNSLTIAGTWKIQNDELIFDKNSRQTGGKTISQRRLTDFGQLFAAACIPDVFENLS
jgi:hypothetical protein